MKQLLILFLVLPALSNAEDSCPWINQATIGGIVGGAVSLVVSHPDKSKTDAVCDFTRHFTRQGSPITSTLQVNVVTMTDVHAEFAAFETACSPKPTPIRAIGNEAVACSLTYRSGPLSEAVISRVRERAFIVRVSSSDRTSKAVSLRDQALDVAEQVAGNLF